MESMFALMFLGWLGVYGYGSLLLLPEAASPPPTETQSSDAPLYLPPTTIGYVSVVDSASLLHHVAQTQLWKLAAQSPALQAELRRQTDDLRKELQHENLDLFEELRRVFSGPITLALLDFEPAQAKDGQPLRLACLAELAAGDEDRALAFLQDRFLPHLASEDKLRWEPVASGPFPYLRLSRDQTVLGAYAVHKGRFLFVTHEPDLVPLATPSAAPLAQSPGHKALQSESQGADFVFYLDTARLLKRVAPSLDEPGARTLQTLLRFGLRDLRTALYTITPAREGYVERFALRYQPASKGPLVQLLTRVSASRLRSLQHTPASSTFLLALHTGSVSALLQDYLHFLALVAPAEPQQLSEGLASGSQEIGVDIEKDILDQLSGEFALALKLPSISGQVVDNPMLALGYLSDSHFSVFLGVNDEQKAGQTVRKLLDKNEVTVTSEPYRGVSVAYLTSTAPLPVIPTYTLHDGLLAFHLNAGTAKASIDAKLDGKDLRADADFRRSAPGPDTSRSSAVSYLRLSELVPLLARLARPDLARASVADPKMSSLVTILEQLETLSRQLHGFSAHSRVETGLFVHETYTPLAASGGLGLFSGAGVLAGMTAFMAAQAETMPPAEASTTTSTEAAPETPTETPP